MSSGSETILDALLLLSAKYCAQHNTKRTPWPLRLCFKVIRIRLIFDYLAIL